MFLFADFWRDLVRLGKHERLANLLWLMFGRAELAAWLIVLIGLGYYVDVVHQPLQFAILILLALILAHIVFVSFVVRYVSPIYFGAFAFGRLVSIERLGWGGAFWVFEFLIVPSGTTRYFKSAGISPLEGTVGKIYLLLLHPSNASLALPVTDDTPYFLAYILKLAGRDRGRAILDELQKLRSATGSA